MCDCAVASLSLRLLFLGRLPQIFMVHYFRTDLLLNHFLVLFLYSNVSDVTIFLHGEFVFSLIIYMSKSTTRAYAHVVKHCTNECFTI